MNPVERELRAMTEWSGPTPDAWRDALDRANEHSTSTERRRSRFPLRFVTPRWLGVAALVAIALAGVFVITPNLARTRTVGASLPLESMERAGTKRLSDVVEMEGLFSMSKSSDADRAKAPERRKYIDSNLDDDDRAVVRKATIELEVDDVNATSLKIRQLISEPRHEFVESADVDASGSRPRAGLVLRVEQSRLEAVLSEIRTLGAVESERIDAEDVTDQIVDLDARLSNERRVEQELLQLLESRPDDDLEDVLALRREIAGVRENIEQLDAQRQNLGRLASLAKIAVIMTEAAKEQPKQSTSLWKNFTRDMTGAFRDGLAALGATAAWLVTVLIGGAPWIILTIVATLLVWRRFRAAGPLPA